MRWNSNAEQLEQLDQLFDKVLGICGRLEDAAHSRIYNGRRLPANDLDALIEDTCRLIQLLTGDRILLSRWLTHDQGDSRPQFYNAGSTEHNWARTENLGTDSP
jgi:hypothetical protein